MQEVEVEHVKSTRLGGELIGISFETKLSFKINSEILYIHGRANEEREHTILIDPEVIHTRRYVDTADYYFDTDEILFMSSRPSDKSDIVKELV